MLTLQKIEQIETNLKKLKEIIRNCDTQEDYTENGRRINRLLVDSLVIDQPPSDLIGKQLSGRSSVNWVREYPNLYGSLFMYIKYNKLSKYSVAAILNNAHNRGYTFKDMSLRKQQHTLSNETIIALYIDGGNTSQWWKKTQPLVGPTKVSFSRGEALPYTLTFKETNND